MLNKRGQMSGIGGGILLIVLGIIMVTAVALPVTVNQISTVNSTVDANTRTILNLYPLGEAILGLGLVFGGGFLTYHAAKGKE